MVDKKKTTWGPDQPSLNDFNFDMDDFGRGKERGEKKRKPIMKIATSAAKGSLGHFSSEQFIRGTVSRSMPRGYDAAIDTSYEIKDTFGQLYNTAGEEYRKIRPQLQRVVARAMPAAGKLLPKRYSDSLRKFSLGDIQSGRTYNEDEETLRTVLGELEVARETERLREYNERAIKDDLKDQVDNRRFSANMKVLASIDARLSQQQAFNNDVVSRYQRRMLEVAYRQYFTQRDTLKLLGSELTQQRQILSAILHNTGLPDMDKTKLREQVGQSFRSKILNFAPMAAAGFAGAFLKNARERMQGNIRGFGSHAGNALGGMTMAMDANSMAQSMGMDTSSELYKMLGGGATGLLMSHLLGRVGRGFSPAGFTAQKGAQIGGVARNWPNMLQRWARSRTNRTGVVGTLESMLKGLVPIQQDQRRVGGSFITEAGEQGLFTKKTQRSIETIIPGFLSKIHHELMKMRSGNHDIEAEVWNDEKEKFTSRGERRDDTRKRIFENKAAQNAVGQARDAVDFMTAGRKLSAGTHQAVTQEIMHRTVTGQPVDVGTILSGKNAKYLTAAQVRELRKATGGRFTNSKTGKHDQVLLSQMQEKFSNVASSTPHIAAMLEAYQSLGHIEDLRDLGVVSEEGDNRFLNAEGWIRHQTGSADPNRKGADYKRGDYGSYGQRPKRLSLGEMLHQTYEDLYKAGDFSKPVVLGQGIMRGKYVSLKTGHPTQVMADVLDGVSFAGHILVKADDAKKLVTLSGETLPDLVDRLSKTQKNASVGGGKFSRVASAVSGLGTKLDDHLSGLGQRFDDHMDSRGSYRGRVGRRRAASEFHAAAAAGTSHASQQIQQAARATAGHAQAAFNVASKGVKTQWGRAMNAGKYALDLYLGNKVVITAEGLKAGQYISALTGKVIKDIRNIADGVKDARTGAWVVSAQDAVSSLHNQAGDKFTDMVDTLQSGLGKASDAVTSTPSGAAIFTAQGRAATMSRAQASMSAGAAAVHEKIHEAATQDHWDPLMELIKEFKEGNLKNLEAILHVLSERDFTAEGGTAMGSGGSGPSFGRRSKDWVYRMADRIRNAPSTLMRGARGAGRMYGRYVKTVFGLPMRAAGVAGGLLGRAFHAPDRLGKEPADVYIKGEKQPRLTRGRMMAGEYFNMNPDGKIGKVIRVPKDIKGPVCDNTGNTIIDLEEFKQGLTDRSGHSLVGGVVRGLWSTARTLGGFYGSLITAPIKALGIAGRFISNVASIAKLPQDVYVTGEKEPRLRAFAMRAGNYVLKDNPRKKVRNVQDITGEVLDISKNPPVIALSADDISRGLVDIRGKPFKVKAGGILARMAHGALGMAGSLGSAFFGTIGAMGRLGGRIAAAPFNLLSNVLGGSRWFGRRFKTPKDGLPTADQKTHGILGEILSLLRERVPKPQHQRANSWQEELKEQHEGGVHGHEESGPHGAGGSGGGSMGGLMGKLKGAKDSVLDKISDAKDAYDLGKGALSKGWKGLKRGGQLLKKGGGWLKRGWGALRGLTGLAAAGEGASLLGGAGTAAAGTATAAEGIAGAAMAGEAVAGTAAAGAAGGGLLAGAGAVAGSILGGIGAVLASPIVIGALIVGAIGYGAYKLYSNHKLKGDKWRSLRMAQYGVDVQKDLSNSKKIGELEELFEPHVTVANGKGEINVKEMKKDDLIKVTKIFGLYRSKWNPMNWFHKTDTKDIANNNALANWMAKRWKPVFLQWVAAVRGINPHLSISDVNSELKPEQKRDLLKVVKTMDASMYAVMDSPFQDDPLTAGKKEVDAAIAECEADIGTADLKKGTGDGPAAASAAAGAATAMTLKSTGPGGQTAQAGIAGADKANQGAIAAAMSNAKGDGASNKVGLRATSSLKSDFGFLGGKISALTAVRYKTYGLTEMDPTKAKALFLLEQDVFLKLDYASDGRASFKDDASYYFDHYGGYFGIAPTDADAKVRWYSWFAKRFVPTILQFSTAVKHANKTVDPRDAENYLGPAHLLDVANMTIAATFGNMLTAASVWSFTDTPFDDKKPLNNDSSSTKENIQALKDAVQKQVLAEQKAKEDAKKPQQANAANTTAKDGIHAAANAGTVSGNDKMSIKQAVRLPAGMESGSQAAQDYIASAGKPSGPVGSPISQPGHGSSGDINSIPQPQGSGSYGALKATLDAAAKMVGVDPKLVGMFAGIESGYNPSVSASTSSAKGLGQFLDSTWRSMITKYGAKYGINPSTPATDPRAAALMLGEYIKENQAYLTKELGRPPTDTEVYMAHFLGAGGAAQFLKAPDNAIGAAVAPKAAAANVPIFYKNGAALTKAQVVKLMDGRLGKVRAKVTGTPSSPSDTALATTTLPNGAKTTTTANGPQGGIGPNQPAGASSPSVNLAAAASSLNAIQPPSGGGKPNAPMTTSQPTMAQIPSGPSGDQSAAPDPVAQRQAQAQQRAVMLDRQAQATQQTQVAQMGDVSSLIKRQVDLTAQMVQILGQINDNTGALPALAKAGLGGGNASQTASVSSPQAPQTTPGGQTGVPQSAPLPRAPVSVARPSYG